MPSVTVIIPTFNRVGLLREAVGSVLGQTFDDWELIVVDDGSTDGTPRYLADVRDSRIRVLSLAHSGSAAKTRNRGAERANGAWLAFLDSDDRWLPDKLRVQVAGLRARPACGWSSTCVGYIDADGQLAERRSDVSSRARSGWILEALLTFAEAATMSSLVVSTALFQQVGGFDEAFVTASREDYDLVLRLAARSRIHAVAQPLTLIREHTGRTTSAQRTSELHRFNEMAFRKALASAGDPNIRAICARQCATQLALRARALSREGAHAPALRSVARALRDAPFAGDVWRAVAGAALRALVNRPRAEQ
jgi:glycosyltransferase involved in cell wall biosynthesis